MANDAVRTVVELVFAAIRRLQSLPAGGRSNNAHHAPLAAPTRGNDHTQAQSHPSVIERNLQTYALLLVETDMPPIVHPFPCDESEEQKNNDSGG